MTSDALQLDQLSDRYTNHLIVEKGLAAKTIEAYASDIAAYLDFLRKQKIATIRETDTATILKMRFQFLKHR